MPIQEEKQIVDSLTIVPESVRLYFVSADSIPLEDTIASRFYTIYNNSVVFEKNIVQSEKPLALINYRVLPFNLGATYSHLDTTLAEIDESGLIIGYQYNPYEQNPNALDFGGLDYNGSFSRGISFGNSQNLVLNSSFNLQMAGEIGDGIEVLAAITDENIPLQPEGNTQQLQEFDKIFIQLRKNNNQLIAGDYELTRPSGYFMNYYKKLQGATFSNQTSLFSEGTLKTKGSVAIARGKFARNNIMALEGNQGPYKLRGAEGERFIIALAGTEKVFIDGQQMTRGLEEDYIIDYNRAEVRFTNKRLITKDSRIIVEFEYSDQNYVRSMYAFNADYEQEKLKLHVNIFSQQDGKKPTIDRDFTEAERQAFINAGDRVEDILVQPAIDTVDFDEFRVLYQLVDTVVNGLLYNDVLRYSTHPDSAIYGANFLEVPQGQGNYIRLSPAEIAANGRVYAWVAPDSLTGLPQGNFISARRLVSPKRQQLYTLGGTYQVAKNTQLQAELGMSNYDPNRFSSLDSGDNLGFSGYVGLKQDFDLGKKEKGWRLETDFNYEGVQDRFRSLNPYRNAEFTRDWNIDNTIRANEHIGKASFDLKKRELGNLEYEFSTFIRDSFYLGQKHFAGLKINKKGFEIDASGSLLETETALENTRFFRPKARLSKTFEKLNNWKIGGYGEREKNERYAGEDNFLSPTSFFYDLYRVFLESPSSANLGFGVQYSQRYDYAPVEREFKTNTIADELNLNGNWNAKNKKEAKYRWNSRLKWNLTYRELEIIDSLLTNQEAKETYLGRTDYTLTLFSGAIRSNTTYEIGSGQEPKIEYVYLEVPAGEGVYSWNDYNADGVLQINEFEVAIFQDQANYIRSAIFTDEFVRSNNVQLNQSLRIEPKAIWYQEKKLKKFLTRFSTQSTLRINRKTREAPNVSPWNPFQFAIPDSALVSANNTIRNSLFFNRTDPKFGFEVGMSDNRNRVVLTTGYESRHTAEQFFKGRWNVTSAISLQFNINKGARNNDSEFFNNKDYQIEFLKLAPKMTWLPHKNFRAILAYEYGDSQNTLLSGGETSINHDLNVEMTYNQTTSTSIRAKMSYITVNFSGEPNSPVGFSMLQGLQNGQNYLWNISLDRKLGKNIQLRLSYEGRKTGTANIIHVGRAQVAALF